MPEPSSDDPRLHEVLAAYLQAADAGAAPDRQELIDRHPELAEALRAFFADHDRMKQAAAGISAANNLPTIAHELPAAAASPLGVVRYFGDYVLIEELARGGMGVVYKARQVSLNRPVALKMILAGQLASAADVQRFQAEAEAAGNLDHPHIVPIYEVGAHQGQHYFSMKLIEGDSLRARIPELVKDPKAAAHLMEMVARAVHHAHQRGILHRDLKPSNILLGGGPETPVGRLTPHVTDFGLAKRTTAGGSLTESGAIVGTPSYMPPEQAAGKKGLSVAADVYALGAVLYECLTGRPPFAGPTALDTLFQVLHSEPVPPRRLQPAVARDLETVCLKCLANDPERRYDSALALAEELGRIQRGEPVNARPVGTAERLLKWVRRRPAIAGLLAAILLLTVVGGYFALEAQAARARAADALAKEAQGRLARLEEKEQAARAERAQVDSALAQVLARPLGYQDGPVSASELDALWEVSRTPSDRVRQLFIERALSSPESAARLRRRADLAVQAAVGLDAGRRGQLRDLLLHKLREDHEDLRVREACASLGVALATADEAFARAASQALLAAMARTTTAGALHRQARGVAILTACLPQGEADRICAPGVQRLRDLMAKTTDPEALSQLGQALATLARRLGPDAAAAVCADGTRHVLDLMVKTTDAEPLSRLGETLAQLAEPLGREEAAKVCERAVLAALDSIADKLTPKRSGFTQYPLLPFLYLQRALGKLAKRLEPDGASRAIQHALNRMSGGASLATSQLGQPLEQFAERLGPDEANKAARTLLDYLTPVQNAHPFTLALIGKALVKAGERLRPEDVAGVMQRVLDLMAEAARPDALALLGTVAGGLAKRLPASEAAPICGRATHKLLEVLATVKQDDVVFRYLLASSLSLLAERLPPDESGRTAAVAMQTLLDSLERANDPAAQAQLAGPVGKMAERLPPQASARAARRILNLLVKTAEPITRAALEEAVGKLAERCGVRDQIELLKHPLCVGVAQGAVRTALNQRFQQHFATRWGLVSWMRQHRPELDLTSPPRRIEH
jgi:hypothetical protein